MTRSPCHFIQVDPVDPAVEIEWHAIDQERGSLAPEVLLNGVDSPSLARPLGLPPCKVHEPIPQLLDLDTHGGERVAAVERSRVAVQRVAEERGDLVVVHAGSLFALAEIAEHLVGQGAEAGRIEFLTPVGEGGQTEAVLQVVAIGTGQVVAELGHPHGPDRGVERFGKRRYKPGSGLTRDERPLGNGNRLLRAVVVEIGESPARRHGVVAGEEESARRERISVRARSARNQFER